MNINEIKDLMAQFDQSSLREFSYQEGEFSLQFSKNQEKKEGAASPVASQPLDSLQEKPLTQLEESPAPLAVENPEEGEVQGQVVESPLVGVAYLSPAPDKPAFAEVGTFVKKGQTLLIIEAMKVMNEVPAPKDGVITEILVQNEEMVEFGKGLVRIQ